jgi:beta-N-acetylhexosaminidase
MEMVRDCGVAYTKACQAQGMAVSIKHFPGDGVDERDQHLVTSINSLSCEEWDASYGQVYRAGIDAGALTLMVGHIMQPAYSRRLAPGIADGDILPASLAPELLGGLLRDQLGFNGMIVSDATTMAGMSIPMPRDKMVPACIAAGCDMFLFAKNLDEDYGYMRAGVEDGTITPQRLDEAVARILAVKAALGLHEKQQKGSLIPNKAEALALLEGKPFAAVEADCADRSITLVKNLDDLLPLQPGKYKRVLLYPIETSGPSFMEQGSVAGPVKEALEKEGFTVEVFQPVAGFEGMLGSFADVVEKYDLIVYAANLSTKSNQTTVRIEWAQPMGSNCPVYGHSIPTIFISFANPYHLLDAPRVRTFINAYKFKPANLAAVMDKLMGRSAFKGQSPVDPFVGRWDTRL